MSRFFSLILILLIGVALSFAGAPWVALRALRAASSAGDVQALGELIDYNATRASLKAQLSPTDNRPPPDIWSDPIGAMKRALGAVAPAPDTDVYLTPKALADLTRASEGEAPVRHRHLKLRYLGDYIPGLHGTEMRYWDPNRARLAVHDPNYTRETLLTFERRGLFTWKLVQIVLPHAVEAD